MSDARRPSPVLSFAWQHRAEEPGLALVAQEPLAHRALALDEDELWVLDLVSRQGDEPRSLDALAEAASQRYAIPRERAERTLARLWPVAFLEDGAVPPALLPSLATWERFGCKLPLEYHASTLAAPSVSSDVRAPPTVPEAPPRHAEDFDLPPPAALPATPLDELLRRRRTCRQFDGRSLDVDTLSFVLAHAMAGGDLPEHLCIHVFALRVPAIPPGVYRYVPDRHGLALVRACDAGALERDMMEMLIGQTYVAGSAVGLLLSGDLDALVAEHRRPAAVRAWLVRVGALAQRMILLGHACRVESFLSAALREDVARRCTAGAGDRALVAAHHVVLGHGDAGEPGAT